MAMRQNDKYAISHHYIEESIFAIKSTDRLEHLLETLKHDSEYCRLNQRNTGELVEALHLYCQFFTGGASDPSNNDNPTIQNTPSSGMQARYSEILNKFFIDGLRIGKAIDRNRFKMYYCEQYGEEIKSNDEQLILDLTATGTLRNDRIFVKDATGQKDLLTEIKALIDQTFAEGASCIYLECLFKRYQSELADMLHIYDVDALESIIMSQSYHNYGKRYTYIHRLMCEPNPQRDIIEHVKRYHTPVTYNELKKSLWYIPLEKIKQTLVTTSSIVNAAPEAYLYAPNLPVSEAELRSISSIINDALLQRPYISDNELVQLISVRCPSVTMNTSEYPVWGLRNVIGYLLRNEFSFRGAIISRFNEELSMSEVFADYCRRNEHITVDELRSFASDLNTVIYWDAVYAEAIRINQNEFIRKDLIAFDIDRIDDTLEALVSEPYVPLKSIRLFLHFPMISVSWNSFHQHSSAKENTQP